MSRRRSAICALASARAAVIIKGWRIQLWFHGRIDVAP